MEELGSVLSMFKLIALTQWSISSLYPLKSEMLLAYIEQE